MICHSHSTKSSSCTFMGKCFRLKWIPLYSQCTDSWISNLSYLSLNCTMSLKNDTVHTENKLSSLVYNMIRRKNISKKSKISQTLKKAKPTILKPKCLKKGKSSKFGFEKANLAIVSQYLLRAHHGWAWTKKIFLNKALIWLEAAILKLDFATTMFHKRGIL